ncbi:mitochondrial branched-chain alpha-ketoacid dehydrogenase kinase-domain-containing protein [Chytriomyces sp. MP71]|nr:mitochondrial branched-chain alpha-ketoacid dehydrogenase kinase-domain-containing protein [Chytriomyces sp. MP71]
MAAASTSCTALRQMIAQSAKHLQTQVSLKHMVEFGRAPSQATILRATQFIHHELPIRIARRVVELENLPYNLSSMVSIKKVTEWYRQSYLDLVNFPQPSDAGIPKHLLASATFFNETDGKTATEYPLRYCNHVNSSGEDAKPIAEYNAKFVTCIETIKRRHEGVALNMALGIQELKDHWRETRSNPVLVASTRQMDVTAAAFRRTHPSLYPSKLLKNEAAAYNLLPTDLQSFLDRFYMSRIGIRMLIGQHVALTKASLGKLTKQEDYVGIVCTNTSIKDVVNQAYNNALNVLQSASGVLNPPEIKLVIGNSGFHATRKDDVHFNYVPSHLHHCLFELFKNSLRATVEKHGLDMDGDYPPIKVVVAEGNEDITIKVSDEGGGIRRSDLPLIWTYMYTTAPKQDLEETLYSDFKAPMAGFGYGLPLSRLYSRYWGGDLKVISMEGFGTDAYLHLNRLSDSEEPLPS